MLLAATACSQSVTVDNTFPTPLVQPLPLRVGVHYTEALTSYSYTEDLPNETRWSFTMGEANRTLFDQIFTAIFDSATTVESNVVPDDQFDAVIEPEILALEFSLPHQSQTDQYAVWIRYNLKIFTPDGTLITEWPVSAYGQSDSRRFKGKESMAQAAVRAMRDAAATITSGFAEQPKIRKALLEEDRDEQS